ncbi:hypothetical protein [Pseudoalteromonas sp. S16_S37]|uniref:hypothetical protein n=1 Tax=Pseudoalteromonas sp. S16_S37 TaxID=2720228 RepID=UPI00168122DD|nr:hypothetical protein [Pseudoalteromonas sp. S16_S37]MBD1582808.1 hypothetical protein [Pseudoalteromonas sp. S16_S37]
MRVHMLSHHSYQRSGDTTSAAGAFELAQAIKDATRLERPSAFNALVLLAMSDSARGLKKQLESINQGCSVPAFLTAASYADSYQSLEHDKFTQLTGQSIEWAEITANTLPLVAMKKCHDDLDNIDSQGKQCISDIDSALNEIKQLKAERDQRLQSSTLPSVDIETYSINAGSANALAQAISQLGNNSIHWAFAVFVGDQSALDKISEVL